MHNLVSIIKLQKNQSVKANFNESHLIVMVYRAVIDYHDSFSSLRSSSPSHSSKIVLLIYAFCFGLVLTREISYMLKTSSFGRLINHKHWYFLSKGVKCSHSSDAIFAIFPSEQRCALKCKVLDCRALQDRSNSSALWISRTCYLDNIFDRIVSSEDAVISFVTF